MTKMMDLNPGRCPPLGSPPEVSTKTRDTAYRLRLPAEHLGVGVAAVTGRRDTFGPFRRTDVAIGSARGASPRSWVRIESNAEAVCSNGDYSMGF